MRLTTSRSRLGWWSAILGILAIATLIALDNFSGPALGLVLRKESPIIRTPNASSMPLDTFVYYFPVISYIWQSTCPLVPPTLPTYWDSRLGIGGLPHLENVRIIPAPIYGRQMYWQVASAVFQNIDQSDNDHTIYIRLLDENWNRVSGKQVIVYSDTSKEIFPDQPTEHPANDPCNCNFSYPLFGDGYDVYVQDSIPSETMAGMVMPEHRHVNYCIIFHRTMSP